jgi:ATP-binding cassette subfamily C (CFTR/MRP) protein 1
MSEEQDDEGKPDLDAKNAVEMDNADFTWERTATQDPDHVALIGKKQTKADIKKEKDAQKQAVADEKLASKTKPSSGNEMPGGNQWQKLASGSSCWRYAKNKG